jgi:hypothetical protein
MNTLKIASVPPARNIIPAISRLLTVIAAGVLSCGFAMKASTVSPSVVWFEPVASEGRSWFKAFFLPSEKVAMRIRLLPSDGADMEAGDAGPASFPAGSIQLEGKVFDFWSQVAGNVGIQPATQTGTHSTIPPEFQYEYIITPRVQKLGWFSIELTLRINGREVLLKRKPGVANSAENYDFLAFARLPEPRDLAGAGADMETPFGVMSALLPQPFCPISAQVELTRCSGASWAREIISWERVNPSPGEFDWSRRKQEIEMLARFGINVSILIQRAPLWTHPHVEGKPAFPEDLTVAYGFAREAAATFGPLVKAWETWNEPDIAHYATETPDRYAAMTKALSLGFSAGAESIGAARPLVLLAAFARDPQAGGYASLLKANDVAPYLDAYNFHTYHPVVDGRFQQVVDTHLKTADMMGLSGRAIWLTETSLAYARNTVPKPMPALSAQLRQLCETYMTAIQQDIKPVFWFMIRPYISKYTPKPSQWGMVDSRLSPVPAYPAFAVMCKQLGAGRFLGSMTAGRGKQGGPANTGRCYIFDNDGDEVAVVLASQGEDEVTLPPVAPGSLAFDVMGNDIPLREQNGVVTVSTRGYMAYVRNPGWRGRPDFMPHGIPRPVAPGSNPPRIPMQRNIVLQPEYPRGMVETGGIVYENWDDLLANWAPRGYMFRTGENIPVTLNIYNFSSSASRGKVWFRPPAGFLASENTFEVEIPAGQKVTVPVSVQAARNPGDGYKMGKAITSDHYWIWQAEFDHLPVSPSVSRWTHKEN